MPWKYDIKDYDKARVVLKRLNLKPKGHKTKNNSSETIKISGPPQPKGIIFNCNIKKRTTNASKPVTVDNHDNEQNVSAIDSEDAQNNVSPIKDSNLVPNKMYKVILVNGQLKLAEPDEDYIVEENIEKSNESSEEIVETDREERHNQNDSNHNLADKQHATPTCNDSNLVPNKMYKVVLVDGQLTLAEHDEDDIVEEDIEKANESNESNEEIVETDSEKKHNQNDSNNMNVNSRAFTRSNPGSVPTILNKLVDKQHVESKNIKLYSINMDSNENLVRNINVNAPNNKMYATLDDLAEAKEGKAMVLLPLEKYTRLRNTLKESQIAEDTLRRQVKNLKAQMKGYQTQKEYLIMEETKLIKQLNEFETKEVTYLKQLKEFVMKEEIYLKQLKEFVTKEDTYLKQLENYKIIEQTYLEIIQVKSKAPVKHSVESQTGPYMEKELAELVTLRKFNTRMSEIFNEAQIAMMTMYYSKKPKECQWPDADKEKVIFLRQIISQSAYLFLKNKMNFPLPSKVDLKRWMKERNIPTKTKNKSVKIPKLPTEIACVAAQETAQTQKASAISVQTHDEQISITILPQDRHIHTAQYQNEQISNVKNHSVDTETSRAISSIVEHQQTEDANEDVQDTMDSNLYPDYMQNDDIASNEEIIHTEMNDTKMNHTEVNHTEVNQTGVIHTREDVHTEVKRRRAFSKPIILPRCRLCMISYTSEEQVREHVPLHYQNSMYTTYLDATKPYTCEFCNEVVKDKNHLIYHHKGHLGIDPLKCYYSGCTYVGSNTANLISHLDRHKPPTLACPQCAALFRTRKYLRSHAARCHSARGARRCALCRATCRTEYTYRVHMQSHDKPPRVRCRAAGCSERFYSPVQMRQHFISAHERLFKCPHCPFASFAFKRQLVRHLRLHETQKENHCVKCMIVFHDYGEYYAHLLDHRNYKEKCACGERFADKDKLAEHKLECTFVPVVTKKLEKRGRKRKNPEGLDFNNIKPKRKRYKKKQQTAAMKPNIIIHKQEIIKEANNVELNAPAMSTNPQIQLPANVTPTPDSRRKIITLKKVDSLPANFRDKLIPLPANFQQKVFTLPTENQQKLFVTVANPQNNDVTLPANFQNNDVTVPANYQNHDVTVPTTSQHTDIVLPANPEHNDDTLPAIYQHNDVSMPTNLQHNDDIVPTNPQHTDSTLSENPQHSHITLPLNPRYFDITLSENRQHTDIILATNPQQTNNTLATNSQQQISSLPANTQRNVTILPENSQQVSALQANTQQKDMALPPKSQQENLALHSQHRVTALPANPRQRVIVRPPNSQQNVTALPANPKKRVTVLLANPERRITALLANPEGRVTALLANPRQRVSTLPANSRQRVSALPANPQQRVATLLANPQQRVITLPANPQQRVTALPADPQRKLITRPTNPQQINIAVHNQEDKLVSAPDNHQIVKPRCYQPNILAKSKSHNRHVRVPVPEHNLQDLMSARNEQKVKLKPGSTIPHVGNEAKALVTGTKEYYLNKLSTPHVSPHKIVTVSTRKKITDDNVLKDMTYVSEFVKTLKSESDEIVPKIESAVPKLKKVIVPISQGKIVHQGVGDVSQEMKLENQHVGGFSQRDMPDLEL